MTGNNPLKNAVASSDRVPWTALQYYHRAVETNQPEKAKLWLAEAKRLGEIVDPSEPRQ